jgi:hypothetical protein
VVSCSAADSVPPAEPDAAPELEVVLTHQPFTLGRLRFGQVPEQQLLTDRGRREPDSRFDGRIQFSELWPQSCLPNVVLHRTPYDCVDEL